MKNPPTLADALVGFSLGKQIFPALAQHCRAMLPARKFVLDDAMSRYWADAEMTLVSGTLKKRIRILDNARMQARLPHPLTWIEHDPRPYRQRTVEAHGLKLLPGKATAMRRGWLLEQHPSIETAVRCTQYTAHHDIDDLKLSYFRIGWVCDDSTPMPWRRAEYPREWLQERYNLTSMNVVHHPTGAPVDYPWTESELLGGMTQYQTPQVQLLEGGDDPDFRKIMRADHDPQFLWANRATCRCLWLMLAMINDIPVRVESVMPSKGYVARGNYRKFLKHSVVHLMVPETKWRKTLANSLNLLRKRAHQVRQHLRNDWRNPLSPACPHSFDENLTCRRCRGRKLWIAEHARGDASLGFVTHDYAVHHDTG